MTVQAVCAGHGHTFTMNHPTKIYPGLACEPGTSVPSNPAKQPTVVHLASSAQHGASRSTCSAVRSGHCCAVHRRNGRARSPVVHRARQSHSSEACAGDDRHLDRPRQRRRAGQSERPRVRHDVGSVQRIRGNRSAPSSRKAVQRQAHKKSRGATIVCISGRLRRHMAWYGGHTSRASYAAPT